MRIAAALLSILLLVAAVREAAAACFAASSTTAPPSGSVLPADPTLYVFQTYGKDPIRVTDASGQPVPARVERIGSSPAYQVYAVRPRIGAGALRVEYAEHREPARFEVSPSAQVALAPPRIGAHHYRQYRWSCSHHDSTEISVDGDAIAYRIEWRSGATRRRAYLPRTTDDFYRRRGQQDREAARPAELELGYVSCFGGTVDHDAFRAPTLVRIVGLYPDGSERDGGVTVVHRTGHSTTDDPFAVRVTPAPEPRTAPAPASAPPSSTTRPAADEPRPGDRRALVLGAAGVLTLCLVALQLARRRRRAAEQRPAVW